MTSSYPTLNKDLRKFESLDIWKQLKNSSNGLLPWYFEVSINRMPAKYLISKSISCNIPDLKLVGEDELWEEHRNLMEQFLKRWKAVRLGEIDLMFDLAWQQKTSLMDLNVELVKRMLKHCNFCRWNCQVDREMNKHGTCQLESTSKVSSYFHHRGEELVFRGNMGSGTIFFTSCNMRCSFCQNGDISTDKDNGIPITPDLLALMIWQLRMEGCHNTNWVGGDPTIHLHTIVQAISILDSLKMPNINKSKNKEEEDLNYIKAVKADNNYLSTWYMNSEYAFYQKHFWIKKSRGIGATTFFLYWIIFKCFKEFKPGDRVIITTGSRINLAEDLILRLKRIFQRNFPSIYNELMQQPATIAIINGTKVEAFPSHLASLRGYDRVKVVILDEADYYPPAQQKELRATVEGFIGKPESNPHIILISTPQAPGMIMESIEKEQNSLYYKFFLTYEYGLEGPQPIYDERQLALARRSPDWPREYEGKYIGVSGNVYSPASITRATTLGDKYSKYTEPENWNSGAPTVLGLDPAWGSVSKYGVVVAQFIDNRIVIAYAAAYSKPDMSEMMSELWRLKNQFGNIHNIMVDSNNPEVIGSIRREFRKDQYSEQGIKDIIANCRKYNTPIENRLFVVPKNFAIENRQMLQHSVSLMDNPEGLVAIPSKFDGLLLAIRTATHSEWKLDKTSGESLHTDITDSFIMALSYFRMAK